MGSAQGKPWSGNPRNVRSQRGWLFWVGERWPGLKAEQVRLRIRNLPRRVRRVRGWGACRGQQYRSSTTYLSNPLTRTRHLLGKRRAESGFWGPAYPHLSGQSRPAQHQPLPLLPEKAESPSRSYKVEAEPSEEQQECRKHNIKQYHEIHDVRSTSGSIFTPPQSNTPSHGYTVDCPSCSSLNSFGDVTRKGAVMSWIFPQILITGSTTVHKCGNDSSNYINASNSTTCGACGEKQTTW